MEKSLNNYIKSSLLISLLLIILGSSIIITNPMDYIETFAYILAGVSALIGLIIFIIDLKNKKDMFPMSTGTSGLAILLIGIILAIHPMMLTTIIPIGLGSWFILSTPTKIKLALYIKKSNINKWKLAIILPILSIIVGILLIYSPKADESLLVMVGILIIIHSITDIIEMIVFKRQINNIETVMENDIKLLHE